MPRIAPVLIGTLGVGVAASGQVVLNAHPGPANLDGSAGLAMFFDLESLRGPLVVTELRTWTTAFANQSFTVDILVRDGTALGGTNNTGPGTSMTGWTWLGSARGLQGPQTNGLSSPVDIPDIVVQPGLVRGVAVWFENTVWGPRVYGEGSGPYWVFQDEALKLTTGDVRSVPFTANGTLFRRMALVGSLTYVVTPFCYPNCDGSTQPPILNVSDFVCFQSAFAASAPYANCDQSTGTPALNVLDFVCFMQQFAAGCQ